MKWNNRKYPNPWLNLWACEGVSVRLEAKVFKIRDNWSIRVYIPYLLG